MTKDRKTDQVQPQAGEIDEKDLDKAVGGYPLPRPVRLLETRAVAEISAHGASGIVDGSSNT